MRSINIIGAGKVGKTLGHLWHKNKIFKIQSVLNSTIPSALDAVNFIGAGQAVDNINKLLPADVTLISTPDGQIREISKLLDQNYYKYNSQIIFHCSGALSSEILNSCKEFGALVGSVHPIHSFADPEVSVNSFKGTYCAFEGDSSALEVLIPAIQVIGGDVFNISTDKKALYHSALVFISNYLVALFEVGLQIGASAGIPKDTGLKLFSPLAYNTLNNISKLGTQQALTGPITRADLSVLSSHLESLKLNIPNYSNLYAQLGQIALSLTKEKGELNTKQINSMLQIFENKSQDC